MHFGDRLELRLEAHPARLPGWPENGYETEEAAERYDRSEIARQDGERRAAALEIDPPVGPGYRRGTGDPGLPLAGGQGRLRLWSPPWQW
jgi:hypothetical protein